MRSLGFSIGALIVGLACATPSGMVMAPVGPRGDQKTLTSADISSATQLDLLSLINAERPQWLRTPDGRPAQLIVYLDDTRLGGTATLRGITLRAVTSVRYYEASAAQQRFSTLDAWPVIHVITK